MLLALLICTQDVELDALGHPDPEERALAIRAIRRPDALPLLLRGRRHPDPEVRARVADALRAFSPLAWRGTSKEALDVLRSLLRSPAPADAAARSKAFLNDTLDEPQSLDVLSRAAEAYGQAVILVGPLTKDAIVPAAEIEFLCSEGVIWAGHRHDLPVAPDLLGWILEHPEHPTALSLLAQMMPRADALLDDPRPEAVDLLASAYALWKPEGPLDPRFAPRLAARLATLDGVHAGAASVVLKAYPKDLAAVLAEGAASPNRWWRYLSAAVTASTPGTAADPAVYARLLRDPAPEIRRAAARAMLTRIQSQDWDCAALLEAVEGLADLLPTLRLSRNLRLQAAAVDSLRRTPEASLAVLEDCDDAGILDAAVVAFRELPDLRARSTAVLRRLTETSDDARPRALLKKHFEGADADAAERAAYALGGLPAGEILGYLEDHLAGPDPQLRGRTLIAIRRVGSRVEPDSCVAERLRAVLRSRAEVEPDSNARHQFLELAEAPVFEEYAPHRIFRGFGRFSCGTRRALPQGGWRALPPPAVPLPDWK